MITTIRIVLYLIIALLGVYACRHYAFTYIRLFRPPRDPYRDIDAASWPTVTIQVAAHNEEQVIAQALDALLSVDYPRDRMVIMPVNDRSTDGTRGIIDAYVATHPGRIRPFHRLGGKPGKAAALKDAAGLVDSEILIVFDADYVPSRGLIKQLVAPFFDPEIGAVMGRVVPLNAERGLLTKLLDIERSGGYQIDQQARMTLRLVPQYGGTTGGVRMAALRAVGGWTDDVLAEDTELTYRLLLRGWKTAYQNRAECYEEVPESWQVRSRQIGRWAKGHNQSMARHLQEVLLSRRIRGLEKLDALLLLWVYMMPLLTLLALVLIVLLFYLGQPLPFDWLMLGLGVFVYGSLGNFAAFFELAAGCYLDDKRENIRLLPLNLLSFTVSMVAVTRATLTQIFVDRLFGRELVWDKTARYRGR